jgi:threonine aldolase
MIDLRSDTVTKPTPEMLEAMMKAEVGDDVFDEDPTVNAFQQKMADYFGFEAGIFVPSGTMSNQLGVKVLTQPGDEILIDEKGHIFNYETAASSVLSGVLIHTLKGERGKLSVEVLRNQVRGAHNWEPRTKVVAIENTTNKGGGVCYSREELQEIRDFAIENGLFVHLDGARIWNAMTKTGIDAAFFSEVADTLSICFSKGLGAPVGSMLLGPEKFIKEAFRFRKMWGGGMRQVGLLAAAADHAFEHHYALLAKDHERAQKFAEVLSQNPKFGIDPALIETNIVMFETKQTDALDMLKQFEEKGIRMVPFGPTTIRATFHFQITDQQMDELIETTATI